MEDIIINRALMKYDDIETMDKIAELSPNLFCEANRGLFEHITKHYKENKHINELIASDEQYQDKILNILDDVKPSQYSIDSMIKSLKDNNTRKIIEFNLKKRLTEIKTETTDDIINNVISDMVKISKEIDTTEDEKYIFNTLDMKKNFFDKYERMKGQKRLLTNIKPFDNTIKIHKKEIYTIAARPGSGKTALSLSFLKNFCHAGNEGLFFSLEMGEYQLVNRLVSSISKVELDYIENGSFLRDEKMDKEVGAACELLEEMSFRIVDKPSMKIEDIISITKKLNKEKPIDFIILDHVGLIKPSNKEEKRVMIDNAYKELKYIAKELDIPVIVLAQLNRGIEHRADGIPKLSDLKDSGSIEEDSAGVIMLKNLANDKVKEEIEESDKAIEVYIRKNRFGSLSDFKLHFEGKYQYIGGIK